MAAQLGGLPDPLDSDPNETHGDPDELISQLAGDEIDRLLGPDAPRWEPADIAPTPSPLAVKPKREAAPVEELAAQLDRVFEEIRQQRNAADPIDPEPVLVMRRRDEPEAEETPVEPRHTLIAPLEEDPLPPMLKPLAWLNAPVAELSSGARLAVSVISILTFLFSISALAYVLMLRQG